MSILNNLTKKYLEEEKIKAKDKFTFIFQSDKDEEVDIKQLKTAHVYHVIDEPQFNENDGCISRANSRIPSGLESTLQGGIKKNVIRTKGSSLFERQFQKQQQTSEQQLQRQAQFEKKGKTIKENIVQKKRDKVLQMKNISENNLKEQEQVAKSVIDIHTKGHLIYVDYGEEQNINVKELRQSPKQSDLQAINYSKIIKKTQEFLEQEEKYEQIKKDLQFKFNFITDKTQNVANNQDQDNSINDNSDFVNDSNRYINEQDKTKKVNKSSIKFNEISMKDNQKFLHENEISKKENKNQIKDIRNVSPINNQKKDPYINLKEGDININQKLTKDQKKKIDKDLFKYLKSESTNFLIEKGHDIGEEKLNRDQSQKFHYKTSLSQNKKLKNSHSAKQGSGGDKSFNILKENIEPFSLNGQNLKDQENNNVLQQKQTNICKTEKDELQQKQQNLKTVNSQLGNAIHKKQEEQNNLKDQKEKSENLQTLNGLNVQKAKIQNKIALQRMKFEQLLNQISFATNKKRKKSKSPSIDLKNKYKSSYDENQIINEQQNLNESQKQSLVEQTDNSNAHQSINGIKLPKIQQKRLQNEENQSVYNSMNQRNRFYSNSSFIQKSYKQVNGNSSLNIQKNDQVNSRFDQKETQNENQKSQNFYNGIDKSRDISRRNQRNNSRLKESSRNNSQNSRLIESFKVSDNSRLVENTRLLGSQKLKQATINSNKEQSFLDQSISSIVDTSLLKTYDTSQMKNSINSKQIKSIKLIENEKFIIKEGGNVNQDQIKQNIQESQNIEHQQQIHEKQKQKKQQQNEQMDEVRNQSISFAQSSPNQKVTSPLIVFDQNQISISFLNNIESTGEKTTNSNHQKEKSIELKQNPSLTKINESQLDKKKLRSRTLQDAEQLLNRIKKRSEHYQEHQELIKSQMDNFNFDNIKQRQIKILQTFKDQKVPDMVKKRLHHDFVDILAMCQN